MGEVGLLAALPLILVHVVSPWLAFLDQVPRSRLLSFSGGVAVGLVFLDIMPELAEQQRVVERVLGEAPSFLEHHIYLVAILGLATFYGADRVVKTSRKQRREAGLEDMAGQGAFWLSMAVFTLKNTIVGYLLASEEWSLRGLLLFLPAILLEFVLSDRALHEAHRHNYDRIGRWVLAAAVIAGYAVGDRAPLPPVLFAALTAFLGGAIILTTLKEELPDERQSRFGAFAAGIVVYAILVLAQ
ncbi:hypothetical protein [Nitrospira moscoviensis]|uniref:Divalent heavy-metal cations transporter n=1 Tax=Nitrospira moscoviensis TaxID=42253 RepID=A0A0K2GE76_NITMO|nr:hypothetical protein [Nitrospira moscoviensis]ALA59256.1 conserved membrane protein of unknown function [Nitrospira moscoviensis]